MKLLDVILEESGDLARLRKLFVSRWKKVVGSKTRHAKINNVEKLVKDLLNQDEVRFLVLKLQKK